MSESQIVICELGDERFGIDIESVFEIIRSQEITAVPTAPSHVEGVINLRGRVIPVVDLSRRFGMPGVTATKSSRIVVVGSGDARVGLVVDGVSQVLMLHDDWIEPTPDLAAGTSGELIRGIAKLPDGLTILLELDALFGATSHMAAA